MPRPDRGPHLLPMVVLAAATLLAGSCAASAPPEIAARTSRFDQVVELPAPVVEGSQSLEEAMADRRSRRTFSAAQIDEAVVGQLLWAGQGVTDSAGHRTAPSAGALYPIELYVVTSKTVEHYLPLTHSLEWRQSDSAMDGMADAAFEQGFVGEAPMVLVIAAVPARTAAKYGGVANALVDREAGHVAQNILLQATVLGLEATPVGGFDPDEVAELLALPPGWDVRYLIPIGGAP